MDVLNIYEIVGVIVTFTVAILAYLRSHDDAKKMNTLFVSILGTVFTLLISLRFAVLPKVESHLGLAEEISQYPRVLKLSEAIAHGIKATNDSEESMMKYALKIELDRLESKLETMSRGAFTVSKDEISDFALKLIEGARQSLDATSYLRFEDWWDTAWGKEYTRLNYEAVRRGVMVQRTFIFSSNEEVDFARSHLDEQAKNGIKVRLVMAKDLDTIITSDMVTRDGKLAGELAISPEKGMKNAMFYTDQRSIDEIQRRINRLRSQAKHYDPEQPITIKR